MNSDEPRETLVVVTGATGFIALHCVRELLERGYRVRGTVRNLDSEAALRKALHPLEPGARLEFTRAELLSDAGWPEALSGATYVLHVASPVPKKNPKDEDEVIRPAREGALRVLQAARAAGVSRVVLTSSMFAITCGRKPEKGHVFDETDWSDLTGRMTAYARSKTLGERAAWDYVQGPGKPLELVTINPAYVIGPSLTGDENTSNEIVGRLVRRDMPGVPRLHFPLVDVRDVATAHVLAMTAAGAAGQRFIVTAEGAWMKQIADQLAGAGYKVPTRVVPDLLVRLISLVDPMARLILADLGVEYVLSNAKARRELGWSGRPIATTVLDAAKSMRPL